MIKNLSLITFLSLASLPVLAQSPGGVSTKNTLWLKANTGVTLSPTNTVTTWNEVSGANIMGNFATQSPSSNIGMTATQNPPSYQASAVNFNPQVVFNSSQTNSISSTNTFPGTQAIDSFNNTLFQVIRLRTMTGVGVWFKWQYNNSNDDRMCCQNNTGSLGKLRFDFRKNSLGLVSNTVVAEKYFLAGCLTDTTTASIRLMGATDATINFPAGTAAFKDAGNAKRLTLGNEEYGDPYPSTIDIAEVILYKRKLTPAERNKVESYLAVKYGMTLDQSATYANNYTSANGTVIWDRSANLPYINNITGIGRDDASDLKQKISKSINTNGIVTISHGTYNGSTLPTVNTANTNDFAADNSFMLFGDNGLTTSLDSCYNSGGVGFLRMKRAWKIQKTGTVSTITLAVKASDVPGTVKRLLVSSDAAFTPANTVSYALDNVNNVLSKSIIINGSTAYFTYTSDSLVIHPTVNTPVCVGSTIQLSANVSGTANLSWTGPQGFNSTQMNPSIANANQAHSGTYTLSGTIAGCPAVTGSVSVMVNAVPAPPIVTTPVIYCTNATAVPVSAFGQNLSWYYGPTGGAPATAAPTPSTAYQDTISYWVTQSNNGCESIRSLIQVQVYTKPNAVILASRPSICQYDTVQFFYFGNAPDSSMFDWKFPQYGNQVLSGTQKGPFTVKFDSAGTQQVRLQVSNNGCVSDPTFYDLKVNAAPIVNPVVKKEACVNETVNVTLNYATPGIDNYNWDFAGGKEYYGSDAGGPYGIKWTTPGLKTISVVATSGACPSLKYTDTIRIRPLPVARITGASDNKICSGDTINLKAFIVADTGLTYKWGPSMYYQDSVVSLSQTTAKVAHPGYITLEVTNAYGCKASDSLFIDAGNCCQVFFPTAFTPNGDNLNDYFRPITPGHHQIATFRVVNRWGTVVFETTEETHGWDGTFGGVEQPVGTYFYYMKYKCIDGSFTEIKGEVNLIR